MNQTRIFKLIISVSAAVAAVHAQEASSAPAQSASAGVLPPGVTVGSTPSTVKESLASTQTDLDWAVVEKALKGDSNEKFPTEPLPRMVFAARRMPAILAACEKFYLAHPEDTRRWKAVGQIVNLTTNWLPHMRDDEKINAAVEDVFPLTAREEWLSKAIRYAAESAAANDVPERERAYLAEVAVIQLIADASKASSNRTDDLHPIRSELNRLAVKFPGDKALGFWVKNYMDLRASRGTSVAALKSEWVEFTQSANQAVRETASGQLRLMELRAKPLEMAFVAADGRNVDLKELRGKVVLVDFWATWCGPCKEEIPNVKKVYAAYHDKGFEVVGITLENPGVKPGDTSQQAAAKLEAAKKKMLDFTASNEMPWPQYFDGKWWKNDYAVAFEITGIPAMFLLDKDGKIVSTNARGPQLKFEVKRLLGI